MRRFSEYKFIAFTLVEVLLTLGIIGVVSTMVLPQLYTNYQKEKVETALKQDYYILQEIMLQNEADFKGFELRFPNNMSGAKDWYNTYFAPYVKTTKVCYNTSGCWHKNGHTKNLNGATAYRSRENIGVGDGIVIIKLTNGSSIIIDGYGKASTKNYFGVKIDDDTTIIVFIDANGERKPNIIGKDIYAAVFTQNGLVPAGNSETLNKIEQNCNIKATGNNAGYFCLQKVRHDGWKISKAIWQK